MDDNNKKKYKFRAFDNQKQRFTEIPEPLLNHPHTLLLIAPKGGGKSTTMINLLYNDDMYNRFFHHIFFFSTTAEMDEKWKNIKIPEDYFFDDFEPEKLKQILLEQKEVIKDLGKKESPRLLFIFDDMGATNMFRTNDKEINKLYFNPRHYNASVWITGQRYVKMMTPDLRTQIDGLILFNIPNRRELLTIHEENGTGLSRKEFLKIYQIEMKKNPHSFIFINYQHPPGEQQLYDYNLDPINVSSKRERSHSREEIRGSIHSVKRSKLGDSLEF